MRPPDKIIRDRLKFYNADCMEIMKQYPDGYFDLAVVDPPYGMQRKMDGTGGAGRIMRKWKRNNLWDVKPNEMFFQELFRVSQNQIIWGANNFMQHLQSTTNFIFWYKHQPAPNFADGELAWTSFDGVCRCFDYQCYGAHGQDLGGKIHPTQKPVALYRWIYENYAQPGMKILDSHLGSGSNAIAAHYANMGEFVGIELDPDYFADAMKRIERETKQLTIFEQPKESQEVNQIEIF